MNKTKIYIGAVLLIGLLFQGCAQKTQLTPEVKKSIDTIKVDKEIIKAPLPMLMTRGDVISR